MTPEMHIIKQRYGGHEYEVAMTYRDTRLTMASITRPGGKSITYCPAPWVPTGHPEQDARHLLQETSWMFEDQQIDPTSRAAIPVQNARIIEAAYRIVDLGDDQ